MIIIKKVGKQSYILKNPVNIVSTACIVGPKEKAYEGMIVGEHNHENDLAVNVVKGKKLTNTRASGSDHTVVLNRPRNMSLEESLDYINSDELVEVTPLNYRLRKKILNTELRKKSDARK